MPSPRPHSLGHCPECAERCGRCGQSLPLLNDGGGGCGRGDCPQADPYSVSDDDLKARWTRDYAPGAPGGGLRRDGRMSFAGDDVGLNDLRPEDVQLPVVDANGVPIQVTLADALRMGRPLTFYEPRRPWWQRIWRRRRVRDV